MSNPMPTNTFESMPPLPPKPPQEHAVRKTPLWRKPILWVLTALFFGVAVGAGSASAKEVEVIKEVPVEKIVEKEVEVEVPVTPTACTDALDYASIIFTMNADAIGTMQDMVKHAGTFDAAGLNADTAKLNKQAEDLDKLSQPYKDAVALCRAG